MQIPKDMLKSVSDIRLVVTDMDGTLLNTDKEISIENRNEIRRLRAAGLKVMIASGRPLRQLVPFAAEFDGLIAHNGAVVQCADWDTLDGIPISRAKELVEKLLKNKRYSIALEMADVLYANFDVTLVWGDIPYQKVDFQDFSVFPENFCEKCIVILDTAEMFSEIQPYLSQDLHALVIENGTHCMIMRKGVDKLTGIQQVIRHYGWELKNVLAFGDDWNDYDMLKHVGIGVAMGNAHGDIQQVAKWVTLDNDQDGVAYCLRQLFPEK